MRSVVWVLKKVLRAVAWVLRSVLAVLLAVPRIVGEVLVKIFKNALGSIVLVLRILMERVI